jgi:DNA repair protein RecO (recombination protein O)
MIEWRDEGIVLAVRPHGETSAIADLFTTVHGRHAGVVRGGVGRRMRPVLQPGNVVSATWRARLDEHIGAFTVEPLRSSAALMSDRAALAALNAITGLLSFALAERDPHAELYKRTAALLASLDGDDWPAAYLRWELRLLDDLGSGLDLATCAVTGDAEGLAYVSPRTGRAVSQAGAGDWSDRLLPLPEAMLSDGPADIPDVLAGLRTTGHFLAHVAEALGDRPLPPARDRLIAELARRGA